MCLQCKLTSLYTFFIGSIVKEKYRSPWCILQALILSQGTRYKGLVSHIRWESWASCMASRQTRQRGGQKRTGRQEILQCPRNLHALSLGSLVFSLCLPPCALSCHFLSLSFFPGPDVPTHRCKHTLGQVCTIMERAQYHRQLVIEANGKGQNT